MKARDRFRIGRKFSYLFPVFTLFGCMTPSEKRLIKSDIAAMQTRMQQVENKMSSQNEQMEQTSSKKAASTNSKMQKLQRDLQLLQGGMDALRVGVITGRMPGIVDDSGQDNSIAGALARLEERIAVIETDQAKILEAIDKLAKAKSTKAKPKKPKNTADKKVSLVSLEDLFSKKRYQDIADQAGAFLASVKDTKSQLRGLFLYAESLYKLGLLRESALKWNDYIEAKPTQELAHAKMRMGDCFRHLGDKTTARIYYEELIADFGSSEEAKEARERLEKLN